MKRKITQPLDFSQPLGNAAPDPIDQAIAGASVDADDFAIATPAVEPGTATPDPKLESASKPAQVARRAAAQEPASSRRAVAEPRRNAPAPPPPIRANGNWVYLFAAVATILWAAAPFAFYAGQSHGVTALQSEPFTIAVLVLLALGPIALFWVLAFVLNQGVRLAAEARFARAQADDMIRPAAIAAHHAGGAAEMIRYEIEQAVSAAGQARHELITLREVLASETANLVEATASSARTAAALTQSVGEERRELSALTTVLEAQVEGVGEAIARQSEMVTQAADLVGAQIREAEARLSASTNELSAAAQEASGAARVAGEDLNRQVARLEAVGTVVTEQIQTVEDSLAEQRAALVKTAHELRAEQEDFGAEVETRQAQLSAILGQVRGAAAEIGQSAEAGGEALRVLAENAADRFRGIGQAAAEERELLNAAMLKSVGALSEAARTEREQLVSDAQASIEALNQTAAQAAEAAHAHTEAARLKVDQLSEASFSAGQQADAAFEARLAQARALIEQSASLVEEAGARAGERLAGGLEAARTTVERLETLLQEVDARTARLPADAEHHSAQVQAVVEQGVEQLLGAARRAADETQAIDSAFQERVRRNYEMLSEAVRLMGVVGGASPAARPPKSIRPPSPEPAAPAHTAEASPAPAAPQPAPEAVTLRPRLKLTPEAADEEVFVSDEVTTAPEEIFSEPEPADKGLSWKEILTSVDAGAEADAAEAPDMIEEVGMLGIDPAALLPRSRIDEISLVLQSGDQAGARDIVRQLAPAAMRRLSRHILTDPELQDRASRFLKGFEGRLMSAITGQGAGLAVVNLLGSDEGRVFLLVDSAVSDLV